MCGIAGFFGDCDTLILEKMSNALAHRGPDDAGIYHSTTDRIGLAHRRLSIIDLSPAGHQPMWDRDKRAAIVFNGEIYNYRELRRDLELRGARFSSNSDTEVILQLYLFEGSASLKKLNGIFAFAIWDATQRIMLLARDGLGVKPLYYTTTPAAFFFASELKALLHVPSLDRSIDHEALKNYITYLYSPGPRTMFSSVRKLPPGQCLTIAHDGAVREGTFYQLPLKDESTGLAADDAVELTRTAVRSAVQRQMVADVTVGAFLSGGLDSSTVAAFARESLGSRRLQCFTIEGGASNRGNEGFEDDLPFAQAMAGHLDVDLHIVRTGAPVGRELEEMVFQLDEPQADPAALNTLYIARAARQAGIKVLLSGTGGDDIFSGYRRHQALQLERFWRWWPRPCRHLLQSATNLLPRQFSAGRRIARAFQHAHLAPNARIAGYLQWLNPEIVAALVRPSPAEPGHDTCDAQPMLRALESLPKGASSLNRMLYLDTKFFQADHNLNYTDKMSMAAGVETRVPLLDQDLVAHAAGLPVHYKLRNGTTKWVLKKAMEPFLPHDMIYRKKTGFGAPLRQWLRGPLGDVVYDHLSPGSLRCLNIFDADQVQKLRERHRRGTIDAAYSLLSIACIEMWLRRFARDPL